MADIGTAAAGKVLQGGGTGVSPTFSTSTFPSTATSTGTLLRADGTNWVATTSTYPDTNAVSTLLYASSTNVMAALPTANNSVVLTNASGVPSLGVSLINDFTYTSSTAATVRTLTVTNTDNTNASSGALIKAVSGGASAGDGVFQASTTTTTWSFGVDNSVTSPTADPFVISQGTALGTNNIMSVATSGEINYPLQPAFFAWLSSGVADVTGDTTAYTIIYDTEVFDQNSDFDLSTSIFTAPVTGKYQFDGQLSYTVDTSVPTSGSWTILTSNLTIRFCRLLGATDISQTTSRSGSVICDLDAADTAKLVFQLNGSTKAVDMVAASSGAPNNHFSGFLAC
jgi:hypothetical protein